MITPNLCPHTILKLNPNSKKSYPLISILKSSLNNPSSVHIKITSSSIHIPIHKNYSSSNPSPHKAKSAPPLSSSNSLPLSISNPPQEKYPSSYSTTSSMTSILKNNISSSNSSNPIKPSSPQPHSKHSNISPIQNSTPSIMAHSPQYPHTSNLYPLSQKVLISTIF